MAQDGDGSYERAMAELRAGRKTSHWMWYVFPQIAGLGQSPMARRYALSSLAEAKAYLAHPVLGPRLTAGAAIVADSAAPTAEALFGGIDAVKLRSSMTLFHRADPDAAVFARVLERYFDRAPDPATDTRLASAAPD